MISGTLTLGIRHQILLYLYMTDILAISHVFVFVFLGCIFQCNSENYNDPCNWRYCFCSKKPKTYLLVQRCRHYATKSNMSAYISGDWKEKKILTGALAHEPLTQKLKGLNNLLILERCRVSNNKKLHVILKVKYSTTTWAQVPNLCWHRCKGEVILRKVALLLTCVHTPVFHSLRIWIVAVTNPTWWPRSILKHLSVLLTEPTTWKSIPVLTTYNLSTC